MYRFQRPKRKKFTLIEKLIEDKSDLEKSEQQQKDGARMSQKGIHLFHDKNLYEKSTRMSKGEFGKVLANIIKQKEDEKVKTGNKIYNFYAKEGTHNNKISVIKHFYTPQVKDSHTSKPRSKSFLLTGVVKNKNERTALKEYISNRRTDNQLYEKILKNILVKGYKQLPERNNVTASYGYTFDEKLFMKYNYISHKDTNLKFVLDTLKQQYVNKENKPKLFLSLSREKLRYKSKADEINSDRASFVSNNNNLVSNNVSEIYATKRDLSRNSPTKDFSPQFGKFRSIANIRKINVNVHKVSTTNIVQRAVSANLANKKVSFRNNNLNTIV